jgi:prostaglandin-endoperoxide synthase 2
VGVIFSDRAGWKKPPQREAIRAGLIFPPPNQWRVKMSADGIAHPGLPVQTGSPPRNGVQTGKQKEKKKRYAPVDAYHPGETLGVYLLSNFEWFWRRLYPWGWLSRMINRQVINQVVGKLPHRPSPFSTISDFSSWDSLTDRGYFTRYLPAQRIQDVPNDIDVENVVALFKRDPAERERLCPKSSLLFPAFAQYLTDSFLRTNMDARTKTTSTHQIDLSALYGRLPAQTLALRLLCKDRGMRGRLKSQTLNGEEYPHFVFEDGTTTVKQEFMALDPPLGLSSVKGVPVPERRIFAVGGDRANATTQVSAINTLLLREHNRIAKTLDELNPDWNDDQVFQTARNILIPMGIRIVVQEYMNHISSLAFPVRTDATIPRHAPWNRPNWIAAEFNLLYRWHSLVPNSVTLGGRTRPVSDFHLNNVHLIEHGLVEIIRSASQQRAFKIGLFNTPEFLHEAERKTIKMARDDNRIAPYNAYRELMGMPKVRAFEEITDDWRVIDALKAVYKDPDRLEFYPGLFADYTEPNTPLPFLLLRLVGVDAFTHSLTNPLLSQNIYLDRKFFTEFGCEEISTTNSLLDIAKRHAPNLTNADVTLTWAGFTRQSTVWNMFPPSRQ